MATDRSKGSQQRITVKDHSKGSTCFLCVQQLYGVKTEVTCHPTPVWLVTYVTLQVLTVVNRRTFSYIKELNNQSIYFPPPKKRKKPEKTLEIYLPTCKTLVYLVLPQTGQDRPQGTTCCNLQITSPLLLQ